MTEVLEQYGIIAASIQRSRGAFICRTMDQVYRLEPFEGSEGRLLREHEIKEKLWNAGFDRIDRYILLEIGEEEEITDKADRLIAADRYRNPYVLKQYYDGHECDLHNMEEVRAAMYNLAKLHRVGRQIARQQETALVSKSVDTFARHNRELVRVRSFIIRQNHKNEFERRYLTIADQFSHAAKEALEAMRRMELRDEARLGLCHGAYQHHNILMTPQGVATVHFEQWHYDNQLTDLYCFMRKLLEKNDFSYACFRTALCAYEEEQALCEQDYGYLYLLFMYPEKFWKLSNHYINSNKAWIPPKTIEKLLALEAVEQRKQEFLKVFAREYRVVVK